MSKDLDPAIETLFQKTADDPTNGSFTEHVMAEVENRRRRTIIGWSVAAVLLLCCAWFAVLVLQDALFLLSQVLPPQLVDLGDNVGASFIAPLNRPSGLAGVAGLVIYLAFRRLFR